MLCFRHGGAGAAVCQPDTDVTGSAI
jgi:hypothetical protein